MIDFEGDALIVTESDLEKISAMAQGLIDLDREIAKQEENLENLKEHFKTISEVKIPEAMNKVGMSEFKLKDGTKIQIQKYYSAKIPEGREEEAFKYLETTGNGSLIKAEVVAKFGKGEEEREHEKALIEFMKQESIGFQQKRGVHPQTLKAFVKEQIESENPLDLELFGVYIGNKTKIGGK